MLKLGSGEPEWLDILPGVRVQFAPIGIKAVRAARTAAMAALQANRDDVEEAGDIFTREMLRRGILAWEGVGNAEGEPVPVSPEAIALFLSNPRAYEAADRAYVTPWVQADMEGNASAGSPNGTGAGATPATNIAGSVAAPTKPAAAVSAPTSRTSSKPRKRKPSGRP